MISDSLHFAKSLLTWVFSRSISMDHQAHGTEKLKLKTQVSEDFPQWSESNNII